MDASRLILATAVALTLAIRTPGAQQPPQPAQPPPFRAGTNFVHVDVYPTANGVVVPDLTAADFEVLEDGKPQKIETFEHVNVRGFTPEEAKAEPTSTRESAAMAETTKGRLFVIFLDTYFVNVIGSHDIRRPLLKFLDRLLGPDDMFTVMTPDMSAMDLSFARRTDTIEDNLRKFWFWGQRDRMFPEDPVEQGYMECYGRDPAGKEVVQEMIQRRRERKVIDALTDLVVHLRGVREGRKAVLTITGGWVLYRENHDLTDARSRDTLPRTGITRDGKLTTDTSESNLGYSKSGCERDRLMLSMIDDRQALYDLFDVANRSNVSFYPINPMGLEASNGDNAERETKGERDATAPRLVTPWSLAEARSENLRELAASTDGLPVVDTNNLEPGLKRIADDLSSYYLLGYASTNAKLDGKFRKISVRVKRAGVDVRARRGYKAPTQRDVDEGAIAEPAEVSKAPTSAIALALAGLPTLRPGVPLRTAVSVMSHGDAATRLHIWAVAELDPALSRQDDWLGGGKAEVVVSDEAGSAITTKSADLAAGQRAVVVDLGELAGEGEIVVRTRVAPSRGGLPYTDSIHLDATAGPPRALLLRRGPATGLRYVPTAVPQFERTDRVRVDLPVDAGATVTSAEVLDRAGKPINVPVRSGMRVDGTQAWASAELSLAPLAPGDYLIRVSVGAQPVVTAFRLVP